MQLFYLEQQKTKKTELTVRYVLRCCNSKDNNKVNLNKINMKQSKKTECPFRINIAKNILGNKNFIIGKCQLNHNNEKIIDDFPDAAKEKLSNYLNFLNRKPNTSDVIKTLFDSKQYKINYFKVKRVIDKHFNYALHEQDCNDLVDFLQKYRVNLKKIPLFLINNDIVNTISYNLIKNIRLKTKIAYLIMN